MPRRPCWRDMWVPHPPLLLMTPLATIAFTIAALILLIAGALYLTR